MGMFDFLTGGDDSRAYGANAPLLDDGTNTWRKGNGIDKIVERMMGYGNWAGPGNKMEADHKAEIQAKVDANKDYNPFDDPNMTKGYEPVDPVDAAGFKHDRGYWVNGVGGDKQPAHTSWEGLDKIRDVDFTVSQELDDELTKNGDKYDAQAQFTMDGGRGFYASRANVAYANRWGQEKLDQASTGVSDFIDGASNWSSIGDAVDGLSQGASSAAGWLTGAASDVGGAVEHEYDKWNRIGTAGKLGMIGGYGNGIGAGMISKVYDWMAD